MFHKIIFHPSAEREYREAFLWYEERLEGLGVRFRDAIDLQLKRITSNAEIYSKKKGNFREAKVDSFPYVVVFKVYKREKIIGVVAVFHTSRNPRKKYRK